METALHKLTLAEIVIMLTSLPKYSVSDYIFSPTRPKLCQLVAGSYSKNVMVQEAGFACLVMCNPSKQNVLGYVEAATGSHYTLI